MVFHRRCVFFLLPALQALMTPLLMSAILSVLFSRVAATNSASYFWFASLGSLFVAMVTNPLCTFYTWRDTYWAMLKPSGYLWFEGTGLFALKTMLSGFCIAIISVYYGSKPRKTSLETMSNLSGANVMSVLVTLLVFLTLLILEAT